MRYVPRYLFDALIRRPVIVDFAPPELADLHPDRTDQATAPSVKPPTQETPDMDTDLPTDGRWTFYDSWEAFPLSRLHERDLRLMGQMVVSYDTPNAGTYGEFTIRFYNHGDRYSSEPRIAARIEAFGDSWRVLAAGPATVLAALDGKPQGIDEIKAVLIAAGYEDRTEALRGTHSITCPTCDGTGDLYARKPRA